MLQNITDTLFLDSTCSLLPQVTEQVATHPPNPGLTQYCGKHDVLLHRTTGVMFQETRKSVMPEWEDGDYVRSVCVCVYGESLHCLY